MDVVHTHCFIFNRGFNGGEHLVLQTDFICSEYSEKGNKVFINQKLCLQSYGNSASMNLCAAVITPTDLRQLANELEEAQKQAENKSFEQ